MSVKFDVIARDKLAALNSATKYPSIPTYHTMDRGRLQEPVIAFPPGPEHVVFTEKVDGTNVRLIFGYHDAYIGSREELLTCLGDTIYNPALGIVDALEPVAKRLIHTPPVTERGYLVVVYLELFGLKALPAWRQYSDGTALWRMFDAALIPTSILEWPTEQVASWRDNGGQRFLTEQDLHAFSHEIGIPVVPRLGYSQGDTLPRSVEDMWSFMDALGTQTTVGIGDLIEPGSMEGYVLRSHDRQVIAKARFRDYERTMQPPHLDRKTGKVI